MPFTPFHLGLGAALKAAGGARFSFMVFGGAQVLMDIEPLVGLLADRAVLHGLSHTVPGALAIGTVAALVGKPVSEAVLTWLCVPHRPLTWGAAWLGAHAGTLSHVGLDALMHADMRPLWPLAAGNPLLGKVDIGHLHLACALVALLGALGVGIRLLWRVRR